MELTLSAIAILAAIAIGIAQYRLQHRVTRIEQDKRDEELAARSRADVFARFERREAMEVMVVWNEGIAVAREVHVALLTALQRTPLLERPFPLEIYPGQPVEIPAAFAYGEPLRTEWRITWDDGMGSHERTMTLSQPI